MAALKQRAVTGIPSRSSEEVEQHARWYMQHTRRVALKKQALDEWRQRKRRAEAQGRMEVLSGVEGSDKEGGLDGGAAGSGGCGGRDSG